MTLTFQKELFAAIAPELPPLFMKHWEEVALDRDVIKLAPDWIGYVALEAQGALQVVTARDDGKLVGYYFVFIRPNLHYRDSKTAFTDIFYLDPDYREGLNGLKLFTAMEGLLRAQGVQKFYVVTKVHLPLTMLMKRLKYRFIERIYTKLL